MPLVSNLHYSKQPMSGFTKLFSSLVYSTVWREDMHVKVTWITMLALADRNGRVMASVPGLADAARVSLEQCQDALDKLKSPDEWSRTKDHEGKRIEEVDGGWRLLNYLKYRELRDADERRIQNRQAVRRHRAKPVIKTGDSNQCKPKKAQAEAEAEAERSRDKSMSPRLVPRAPSRAHELANAWNDLTTRPIPKCRELTKGRHRLAEVRLKERPMEEWRQVITRIQASDFCRGQTGRGDWVATFDWLLQADTATKVLEGKYDNRPQSQTGRESPAAYALRSAREFSQAIDEAEATFAPKLEKP